MRHSFERYSVLPYRAHHYFLWHGDDVSNHPTPADADGAAADGAAGTDGTEETASARARAPRRPNARLTKRLTKLVTQHRPIHLFFAGNCRRRDGGVRATILAVHDRMRATAQRNVVVNERVITGPTADWQNTSHVRKAAALAKDTAQQMLASDLCLCPAGDTLSSRRLFDALAAGCVPVIVVAPGGSFFDQVTQAPAAGAAGALRVFARRHLPFADSIDWPAVAFYWVARPGRDDDLYAFLMRLSSAQMRAAREVMRVAGRLAFLQHMDAERNAAGVVSAILATEARQEAAPPRERATHTSSPTRDDDGDDDVGSSTSNSSADADGDGAARAARARRRCLGPGGMPSGGRVVFLKTHKTASGSLFSILTRAAIHDLHLRIAVPRGDDGAFGWPGAYQHGQSGRLGGAMAGRRRLLWLRLQAWGCPPHS